MRYPLPANNTCRGEKKNQSNFYSQHIADTRPPRLIIVKLAMPKRCPGGREAIA